MNQCPDPRHFFNLKESSSISSSYLHKKLSSAINRKERQGRILWLQFNQQVLAIQKILLHPDLLVPGKLTKLLSKWQQISSQTFEMDSFMIEAKKIFSMVCAELKISDMDCEKIWTSLEQIRHPEHLLAMLSKLLDPEVILILKQKQPASHSSHGIQILQELISLKRPDLIIPILHSLSPEDTDLTEIDRKNQPHLMRLVLKACAKQEIEVHGCKSPEDFLQKLFLDQNNYLKDGPHFNLTLEALLGLLTSSLPVHEKSRLLEEIFTPNLQRGDGRLLLKKDRIKNLWLLTKWDLVSQVRPSETLDTAVRRISMELLFLPKPVDDLSEKCEKLLPRNPGAIFIYLATLRKNRRFDQTCSERLGECLYAALEGEYASFRYDPNRNPHLSRISKNHPELLNQWQRLQDPIDIPDTPYKITVTDRFEDLLLATTETPSCLAIYSPSGNNIGLLGLLLNGQNHLIAIKNKDGTIIGRAVLRLLFLKDQPILFLDDPYFHTLLEGKTPYFAKELYKSAQKEADRLQIPLAIITWTKCLFFRDPDELIPQWTERDGQLVSEAGLSPWEHSDNTFGLVPKIEIRNSFLIYNPATLP